MYLYTLYKYIIRLFLTRAKSVQEKPLKIEGRRVSSVGIRIRIRIKGLVIVFSTRTGATSICASYLRTT